MEHIIEEGKTRQQIVSEFYGEYSEEGRLDRTVHGRLEFATTMNYIHRYVKADSKILEIGAGTGRYSISLAKEGYDVTSVELVKSNLEVLRSNSIGIKNIHPFQGDGTDLSRFEDETFDVTLVFGPMYHLYEKDDVNKAIDEAIRVTKKGGVILYAFLSIFGIMYSNYFDGNWAAGEEENFTSDYKIKHFKEQLFTGYDIVDFEELFKEKEVEHLVTTGVDGIIECIEQREDFAVTEEDFEALAKWYLAFCEKRELLGSTNHLLYICRKG